MDEPGIEAIEQGPPQRGVEHTPKNRASAHDYHMTPRDISFEGQAENHMSKSHDSHMTQGASFEGHMTVT